MRKAIIWKSVNRDRIKIYSAFPLQSIAIGKPNRRRSKFSLCKRSPAKKIVSAITVRVKHDKTPPQIFKSNSNYLFSWICGSAKCRLGSAEWVFSVKLQAQLAVASTCVHSGAQDEGIIDPEIGGKLFSWWWLKHKTENENIGNS